MKKLLVSILIISIMIIGFIPNVCKAADELTANLTITSDKTSAKPGEYITFTIKISGITNADGGAVNAAGGVITYDTDFFEAITSSDCSGVLNPENGKFNFAFSATGDQELGTIKLKVKSGVEKDTTGRVVFSELEASDGEQIATSQDASITITAEGTLTPDPTPTPTPDPTPTPVPDPTPTPTPGADTTKGNDTVVKVDNESGKKDNTIAKKDIPHAGMKSIAVIVVAVACVGFIVYRKYKSYSDIK